MHIYFQTEALVVVLVICFLSNRSGAGSMAVPLFVFTAFSVLLASVTYPIKKQRNNFSLGICDTKKG